MITNIFYISIKKIFNKKTKSYLLIVPIALIICAAILISSQITNISSALSSGIFSTIQNQNSVLQIKKNIQIDANDPRSFFNVNSNFTQVDLDTAKKIPNISNVSINYNIPVKNSITKNLFDNISLPLGNISVIDEESAKIFTDQPFIYETGKDIPIILNAKSFIETYEDWGGQTEIEITRPTNGTNGANRQQASGLQIGATKQRNISYNKDDLIGKEIEISFGGLDSLPTFKIQRDSTTRSTKFIKLTDEELATSKALMKTEISKYYDFDKISTPVTFKFKVVGLIENESNTKTYIPTTFGDALVSSLVNNERTSRTTDIPVAELNQVLQGMTFDGETLSLASGNGRGGNFGGQGLGGANQRLAQNDQNQNVFVQKYNISGLVIETNSDTSAVVGIYKGDNYWSGASKTSDTVSLKISDLSQRNKVIKDLNAAGFSYVDVSKSDTITNLENTLKSVSGMLLIGFVILLITIVIFSLYKYVSDSRKEIGVFRAIGMTSKTVLMMILLQAIICLIIGILLGTGFGILANTIAANFIHSWFDSNVVAQMKTLYGLSESIPLSTFMQIDYTSIIQYLVITLLVGSIISLIPAYKASSVKPIEAIIT